MKTDGRLWIVLILAAIVVFSVSKQVSREALLTRSTCDLMNDYQNLSLNCGSPICAYGSYFMCSYESWAKFKWVAPDAWIKGFSHPICADSNLFRNATFSVKIKDLATNVETVVANVNYAATPTLLVSFGQPFLLKQGVEYQMTFFNTSSCSGTSAIFRLLPSVSTDSAIQFRGQVGVNTYGTSNAYARFVFDTTTAPTTTITVSDGTNVKSLTDGLLPLSVTVTNSGNVALSNIRIGSGSTAEVTSAFSGKSISSLAIGASASLTGSVNVSSLMTRTMPIPFQAYLLADYSGGVVSGFSTPLSLTFQG